MVAQTIVKTRRLKARETSFIPQGVKFRTNAIIGVKHRLKPKLNATRSIVSKLGEVVLNGRVVGNNKLMNAKPGRKTTNKKLRAARTNIKEEVSGMANMAITAAIANATVGQYQGASLKKS
jgi:hypothetical protein